jgi:CRP-like cAMP-binding protein
LLITQIQSFFDTPKLRQNHLLAALPEPKRKRLLPHMELVPLRLGDALYESGDNLKYVYYPTTAIVSLLYVMENGASAEIAMVGNDGIVGIALFLVGKIMPSGP